MNNSNNKWFLLSFAFVILLAWLFCYQEALSHMVHVWGSSEAYKHCFFIPLVAGYLIYEKKSALQISSIKPVWWLLVPLFFTQIAYTIFVDLRINLLMHASAYFSFVLLVWSFIGHAMARTIAFPLLFLAFCVPFGEELVPILQDITADLSVGLLRVVGIPVYREGLYIYLSNGTFHVAEACAGVRFLIGTFAIGVLLAYLNYQKFWKRLAFIIFCAVIPILANGVRAFGIMVIGYMSDMRYATGADHLIYGWVFFAFVTIVIFLVGMVGNDKPAHIKAPVLNKQYSGRNLVWLPFCAVVILLIPSLISQYSLVNRSELSKSEPFVSLRTKSEWIQTQRHAWAAATEDSAWVGKINNVNVRMIYVNEVYSVQELVSSRHRIFDNDHWSQKRLETKTIHGMQVDIAEVVNIRGESKMLAAWYAIYNLQSSSKLKVKVYQLMNKLKGIPPEGYYIVAEFSEPKELQNVSQKLGSLLKYEVEK